MLRIVVRGDPQAVIRRILRRRRTVHRLEIAFLVQLGLALLVHFVPDVRVGLFGILDCRINHLDPVFILPPLDILKLVLRQRQVEHAHGGVVVDLQVVERGFAARCRILVVRLVDLADRLQACFLRDRPVEVVFAAVDRHVTASVDPEDTDLRRQLCVIQVHGVRQGAGIRGLAEDRDKDGIQHQDQDDPGGHHAALVLPETVHGVPEIPDRFGLQFFVVRPAFHGHEAKLVLWHLKGGVHLLAHTFLLPILILGSMNP